MYVPKQDHTNTESGVTAVATIKSWEQSRRRFCLTAAAAAALASLTIPTGLDAAPERPARLGDVVGRASVYKTKSSDTLIDIARRNGLGYTELVAANPGVDPWLPGEGVELTLPTEHLLPRAPREGIVLNLADQRVYFFPSDGSTPQSMPVGIGRQGWKTPLGRTHVRRKKADPPWYVPASIRAENPDLPKVVAPGPDNPLGRHAIYLGWPSYLLHGTNKPSGVGRRVSHGCVRLYPEDIEKLFSMVTLKTPVTLVDQPAKIGWRDGELLLEVHPSQTQADRVENGDRFTPEPVPELEYLLIDAAGKQAKRLDWSKIRKTVSERRGVPVPVLLPKQAGSDNNIAQTPATVDDARQAP